MVSVSVLDLKQTTTKSAGKQDHDWRNFNGDTIRGPRNSSDQNQQKYILFLFLNLRNN